MKMSVVYIIKCVHYIQCCVLMIVVYNDIKRIELDTHTSIHCPQRKVNCEFVVIGCKWSDKEEQLGQHLEEKWREHIALALSHSAEEVTGLQRTVTKLSERVDSLELQSLVRSPEDYF